MAASGADGSAEPVSFALEGRSLGLDPRTHAYRDDVADMALAGKVLAHYYAIPNIRGVAAPMADLYKQPDEESELGSQLLFGHRFAVVDMTDGWSWGYGLDDRYVGYVRTSNLGEPTEASHVVAALSATLDGIGDVPMGSLLTAKQAAGLGDAALEIGDTLPDPVATAEKFADTPYLWGGRTSAGIDCSGLVQIAWAMAGHQLPRDSDLQLAALDTDIAEGDALQRGDIVFFPNRADGRWHHAAPCNAALGKGRRRAAGRRYRARCRRA